MVEELESTELERSLGASAGGVAGLADDAADRAAPLLVPLAGVGVAVDLIDPALGGLGLGC